MIALAPAAAAASMPSGNGKMRRLKVSSYDRTERHKPRDRKSQQVPENPALKRKRVGQPVDQYGKAWGVRAESALRGRYSVRPSRKREGEAKHATRERENGVFVGPSLARQA